MRRTYRYILYFIVGILIYYAMEADKNPEALDEIHNYAPFAILLLFLALMAMRYYRKKREE